MTTPKKPAPAGSIADLTEKIWGRAAHRAPDVQLTAIRELRILIDQQEQQSAFTMRNMGWSWQAIADAAGMKHRQQAQEKFRAARLLDKMSVTLTHVSTPPSGERPPVEESSTAGLRAKPSDTPAACKPQTPQRHHNQRIADRMGIAWID